MEKWKGYMLASVVGATTLLAGCGSNNAENANTSSTDSNAATTNANATNADSQEKFELRVSSGAAVEEAKAEQAAIDAFMKKNPNITVKYEPIPGDDATQKLLSSIAAGNAPDVFLIDSVLLPQFIDNNALLDLAPFTQTDTEFNKDVWFENVYNIGVRGDKLYEFPRGFTPMVVYYNKDVFDKAGVAYPKDNWTWQDFLDTAKKLTKDEDGDGKTDIYGMSADPYFYKSIPFVWQNGSDVLDKDGTTADGYLNSPATVEAWQMYTDLVKQQVSPTPSVKKAFGDLWFQSGKVAMQVSGHWTLLGINDTVESGKFDISKLGVVGLPRNKERVSVMYEAGWGVASSTKHQEAAYKLAKFMSESVEGQKGRVESGLELSAVKSVQEEYAKDKPIEQVFVDEVQYARQPWGSIHPKWAEIETQIDKALEQVVVNGISVKEAMDSAVPKIDAIIKDE
ncbi:sugar ABC transporter substrate-binding protein [Paenibacillus sp. CF384]|uniref:ABC transporter substrate-binding protein n=1 Tax=Paenibacillus sp. CF384 TaxID=1884382 RepID=UPI00089A3FFA|nr:sugar ABC transporter substrate-binding protein [Paenibacillus sp. CF384]SDW41557.1 carbohydrate ABC transporter substrate-binding protein, CUT1 family [Paenibacillus sp. CF384]